MRPFTRLSESVELLVDRSLVCTVVTVRGSLSSETTEALRDRLLPVLRHCATPVIFDLSEISTCDVAGLALLVGAHRRARLQGFAAALASPGPHVWRLLRSTGLHRVLPVHPSVHLALLHHTATADRPVRTTVSTAEG